MKAETYAKLWSPSQFHNREVHLQYWS